MDGAKTIRDIANEEPRALLAFQRLGIDYCCGAGRTLADACDRAGVSLEELERSLEDVRARGEKGPAPPPARAGELIALLEATHHVYTREALATLVPLAQKVARVHGERLGFLGEVRALVEALRDDLIPHLEKEERVLFPYVRALDVDGAKGAPPFGTVQNPIRMMHFEHDRVGELLRALRASTSGFTLPSDACGSFRALYQGLEEFEADLHRHIYLENEHLFPEAVRLEGGAPGSRMS
ncbi:MAG: DUF542 domain-containing protein [Polyangiaceae bacterium]|jgi:regulator of cell morphogenesis and NO signaling|nr:DUF542 domain-containing protein [Polyangiaceae bacterium]